MSLSTLSCVISNSFIFVFYFPSPYSTSTLSPFLIQNQSPAGKTIPDDVDELGNHVHHYSAAACAVDLDAAGENVCVQEQFAQEYNLGYNREGEHWITFMQSSSEWLQLGTCCTGDGCGKDQGQRIRTLTSRVISWVNTCSGLSNIGSQVHSS